VVAGRSAKQERKCANGYHTASGRSRKAPLGELIQSQCDPALTHRPLWHVPPHAGAAEMSHVELAFSQKQDPVALPPYGPHTCPLGQFPPHIGDAEMRHVSSGYTHVHEPNVPCTPDSGPQTWPLGHVPPQAGVSETKQVVSGAKQVQ